MADLEETALKVGALLEESGFEYIVGLFQPDREFKTLANAKAWQFMTLIDELLQSIHMSPREAFRQIDAHRRGIDLEGAPQPPRPAPGQGNWRWN